MTLDRQVDFVQGSMTLQRNKMKVLYQNMADILNILDYI